MAKDDLQQLLGELLSLGARIGTAIDGGAAAELVDLMAEKQRLTTLVNARWPQGELPSDLAESVAAVRQVDAVNLVALQGRIGSTEGRLQGLRESFQRSLSYREGLAEGTPAARFLDRRG